MRLALMGCTTLMDGIAATVATQPVADDNAPYR